MTESLVAQIEQACWNYLLAGRGIEIVERSLRLAEDQLAEVRERIAVGRVAEIEQAAAEAEVALRRENLINARSLLAITRLNLLRLVNPPGPGALTRELVYHRPAGAAPAGPGHGRVPRGARRAPAARARPGPPAARARRPRGREDPQRAAAAARRLRRARQDRLLLFLPRQRRPWRPRLRHPGRADPELSLAEFGRPRRRPTRHALARPDGRRDREPRPARRGRANDSTGAHRSRRRSAAWPGWSPVSSTRPSEGRLAFHRQLLPRRRVRLGADGLPIHRHPARRDEQGTLRVALQDRRRGDRHPRHRKQRQGNLRQVLGAAPFGPGSDDLQPVRGVRQLPLALRGHRHAFAEVLEKELRPGETRAARSSPPVPQAPSTRAITSRSCSRRASWPPARRSNAPRCCPTASARTASRGSATSTCRGSTTSRTPTW